MGLRVALATAALLGASLLPAFACGDDDDASKPARSPGAGGGEPQEGAAPALADEDLRIEAIEGFNSPTQIAFIGDDEALVAEKATGKIVHLRGRDLAGVAAQLATNGADERGVLGLTLHPEFTTNRYVYVYWTWRGGEEPGGLFGEPTQDIEQVPPLGNRVDRFAWDGATLTFDRNIIRLPSRTTDLTLDRRRGNHNAGVIAFGPDGKLYVAIGDQNDRGPLQNVVDGEQRSGIDSLAGVVLRLNDDGTTPFDNPFAGRADDRAWEAIFVYGLRNTYGFDWDPANGSFWLQINGQASYDGLGRYQGGDNAGWIQIMGPPERFADYKQRESDAERQLDSPAFPPSRLADDALTALSRLFALPGSNYRAPLLSWQRAIAPAAIQFVEGDALGDYGGDLLLGDVNTGTIYRFELTEDRADLVLEGGLADRVNDNVEDAIGELEANVFGSGFTVATDIEQAPDGSIWIASMADGALYRISR
jgi:glucose/arabinose dehydrogenase